MTVALYMDHNVPRAITAGLQRRGIDVLRAYEDGAHEWEDAALLDRAQALGRVLFSRDPRSRSQVEPYDFCSGGEPRYEMRLPCAMMPSKEATTGGASWQ